ncbi:hypothetical protein Spb1_24580 [Planctopirus ephydatiae]|uniref:Uncharacterized protein n=1 Tax=Planctopirus ephydatiae TaxID=2528019 RepID=A0A518GPQ9_9PLAN|nr:hypothetical protein [Planctopirus ephydatiae]QDV30524.1 hypothetical protein Spb1_24580 [Planctopirus ephydatiae]
MAAICIRDDRTWKCANWVYEGVCEAAQNHLQPNSMISLRIDESLESRVHYLDITDLSTEAISDFHQSVEKGLRDIKDKGDIAFALPECYPQFIAMSDELMFMLSSCLASK